MLQFQKIVSPLRGLLRTGEQQGEKGKSPQAAAVPHGTIPVEAFPLGYSVYGIAEGPSGSILVGAGDPATSTGAVFLGGADGVFRKIELPGETALLSTFLAAKDGCFLAGGMTSIGRGSLLVSDPGGVEWRGVDLDLHPFSAISALHRVGDGTILAATGQMITQGKTRPVLFRSADEGETWVREEQKLPITQFLCFENGPDGALYAGTAGDHTPMLYRSADGGRTFEALPDFPAYKTYKTLAVRLVNDGGDLRLFVVLWGYKTEIADRVVRIYASTPEFSGWEELPAIDDSHFLFSFLVTRNGTFLGGSEKGRVYRSTDRGRKWDLAVEFPTNIGAYALCEDARGRVWIGKDFVPPSERSLWRLA